MAWQVNAVKGQLDNMYVVSTRGVLKYFSFQVVVNGLLKKQTHLVVTVLLC